MSYRRMDFRPDKLPRLMVNHIIVCGIGPSRKVQLKPRTSSGHRQEFKNSHKTRQRRYNHRAIDRGLLEWRDDPCG